MITTIHRLNYSKSTVYKKKEANWYRWGLHQGGWGDPHTHTHTHWQPWHDPRGMQARRLAACTDLLRQSGRVCCSAPEVRWGGAGRWALSGGPPRPTVPQSTTPRGWGPGGICHYHKCYLWMRRSNENTRKNNHAKRETCTQLCNLLLVVVVFCLSLPWESYSPPPPT